MVDGAITELTIIDPDVAELQIPLDGYPTLTELFDLLEDAVERNASSISVDWDADYGFPVDIYIDYEENTADEELGYEVRAFTPTS